MKTIEVFTSPDKLIALLAAAHLALLDPDYPEPMRETLAEQTILLHNLIASFSPTTITPYMHQALAELCGPLTRSHQEDPTP